MLERIIEQFGLQLVSINEVEDSYSSSVYKCKLRKGETIFIKIPYSKLKFQRELEAYNLLKGKIVVPELLDYWTGDEGCPGAFLLSELKGEPLSQAASPITAYHVGIVHASLHSIQPSDKDELIAIQNEFPNWSEFLQRLFYSFADYTKDLLDESLYKQAIDKFEIMKQQLPSPDGPSFVHMDFRPGNIIVNGNQVSGIIDFESVRFGSTEIDFTKLYRDFLSSDNGLYLAYKEGYQSIRPLLNLEIVLPFYQFTDAFNSIGWCKKRGVEKNAAFLEKNLAILKKWLP